MKFVKQDQLKGTLDEEFSSDRGFWDLGNEFISYVKHHDEKDERNETYITVHNKNDLRILSPAEREIKEEKFAREIQKKIENIKIECVIDAVYIVCSKDQLMDVLTNIEQHINNQH